MCRSTGVDCERETGISLYIRPAAHNSMHGATREVSGGPQWMMQEQSSNFGSRV